MPFLTQNIDRAIVMTQYDLRGFAHPMGTRMEENSPKYMHAIVINFLAFVSHTGDNSRRPTDETYFNDWDRPYEDHIKMCQRLYEDCDLSEQEAIKLIVEEILRQFKEFVSKAEEEGKELPYLPMKLDKTSRWGRSVLALAEAFEVEVGEAVPS